MKLITNKDELRTVLDEIRREGRLIGLVPTMGALHEGHLSLVRASRARCDVTVVTIFVNPTQFAPGEDLDAYPRTFEADCEKLEALGVDVVFAPRNEEMYREDHDTWVEVGSVTSCWEGAHRPTHFRGVATIVLKLFHLVGPDAAFFGQKDYQQALVIRRMVDQLDVPVDVVACPIVREPDGLAMSSRNAYLSPDARQRAVALSKSLARAEKLVEQGEVDCETLRRQIEATLLETAPDAKIDYITIADARTLKPLDQLDGATVIALAVTIDSTRLIDNCLIRIK